MASFEVYRVGTPGDGPRPDTVTASIDPAGHERARAPLFGDRTFLLLWILLTAVNLIPVWSQRLLPILDAPNHLALVRGWHSNADPTFGLSQYFAVRIRAVPYILFYAIIHFFMYAVNIETAYKLFLSLYLVLFPLSVLAVAKALGRDKWLALGAFPLSFNPAWNYGYSAMLLGNCFAFLSVAALVAHLRNGRASSAVALSLACLGAYFSHILPWTLFGLGAGGILLLYRPSWRGPWRRHLTAIAAMLPSVMVAASAYLEERHVHAYVQTGTALKYHWRDFPTLVLEFPGRLLEIFPGPLDTIVLVVLLATTSGLYLWRRRRPPGAEEARSERTLKWLIVLLCVGYLYLPYQITGPIIFFQIAQRLPPLVAALCLLLPRGHIRGRERFLLVPLCLASIVLPFKLSALYRDFDRRNQSFIHLVESVPYGKTVFVAVHGLVQKNVEIAEVSGDPASSGPVYWHFSSWPMVLRGGFSPHLFDQGVPIRYLTRLSAPGWSHGDRFSLRDAPAFDYYLVRDPARALDFEPALAVEGRGADWTLYRRKFDLNDEP
jgi:hypothetical protein